MQKRVALVVGIGNYTHFRPLKYCPPSAEDVYNLLVDPKFGHCAPEHSILETVKEEQSCTTAEMNQLVDRAIDALKPGDQFLFYFCGHAEVYQDDLFLALPDSKPDDPLFSFDFSASLVKKLRLRHINKAILIVDACHSAAMFKAIKDLQGDFSPQRLPKGIGFMAACGEIEYARQSPELERTLFSYYLCEGIRNWSDTGSPDITPSEVREYINEQIKVNHPKFRQKAHTWVREGEATLWLSRNPAYYVSFGMSPKPSNPFKAGRPVWKEKEFIDREKILATVFAHIKEGQSTILVGWPSVGKSSILMRLEEIHKTRPQPEKAESEKNKNQLDLIFCFIDCYDFELDAATPADFWMLVLEQLRIKPLAEPITRLIEDTEERGYRSRDLKRLFASLAHSNQRVVLLIDEFQILPYHPNFKPYFFSKLLRTLTTSTPNQPAGLVLVSASRKPLDSLTHRQTKKNLFTGLKSLTCLPFKKKDVLDLLNHACADTGVTFNNQDRVFLHAVAGRDPLLVQLAAASLWEVAYEGMIKEDRYLQAALDFHNNNAKVHFQDVWDHLDSREKQAILLIGLLQIRGQLRGKIFNVDTFGTPLESARSVPYLTKNELVERVERADKKQNPQHGLVQWGQKIYRIAADSFVWSLSDELLLRTRRERDFRNWLRENELRKPLTEEQWQKITDWTNEMIELTEEGVETLIKATISAVATTANG